MRVLLLVASIGLVTAQTAEDHRAVIAELGRQADIFERNAHRFTGIEVFRQTVPDGVRSSTGRSGVNVGLPGFTREIVSEYGFISEDVRGGSLREVRVVLSIDGLRWNKPNKGFAGLAQELVARDEKGRRKLLEAWEEYGLSGFITDLGQLILLFARGNVSSYDIAFQSKEGKPPDEVWIYTYNQRGGDAALTIHGEGSEPVRERLHGRIWVQPDTRIPVRISLESERKDSKGILRDIATVNYFSSPQGTLLPARIEHKQFGEDMLLVTDEFIYSNYKEVLPAPRRRRK